MNTNKEKIAAYFTDDIRANVQGMSNKDMRELLLSLEGTPQWFAILKYNQDRISSVQNSFLVLDPVKEPSKISQYQGVITGVLDLQDAVLSLKFESEEAENPTPVDDKDELGGAYSAH